MLSTKLCCEFARSGFWGQTAKKAFSALNKISDANESQYVETNMFFNIRQASFLAWRTVNKKTVPI